LRELKEGSSFDNRMKETPESLQWFKDNLYLENDVLYWMPMNTNGRKRSTVYANKPAGCVSKRGYIQVRKFKDKFMAHRIIWAMHYGEWPDSGIDHENGDRLDNRIENMRDTTQFTNCKNAAKYPRKEPWIATGVNRSGSGFTAQAQVDKVNVYLGKFKCHTAAMIARKLFDQGNGFSVRHGLEVRVY